MNKMTVKRYIRQADLVDCKIFDNPITVIGAGGIGSFTTLTLAKMGFYNITVYDFDKVEEHNLPNQFYSQEYLGDYKVMALKKQLLNSEGVNIDGRLKRWLATDKTKGVLISAVDNMDSREAMWNYVKKSKNINLFIDGRMGRLQAEIYTIDPRNKRDTDIYNKRIGKYIKPEPLKCTEKAIIYNVVFIASMICNQLKLALEGKIYKPWIMADLQNTRVVTPMGIKVQS